jgi:ligand-binding sensor domain-containing protein
MSNGLQIRLARIAGSLALLVSPVSNGVLLALSPEKAFSQYSQSIWQTEQGLPHNSVNSIVQTRDGYLWLATEAGLARFDGVKFTVFDPQNTKELTVEDVRGLVEGDLLPKKSTGIK